VPWRTDPARKKLIQFFVGNAIPILITRARNQRGIPSLSAYCRDAIARQIATDLGMDFEDVMKRMPPTWEENPGAVRISVD